MPPTTTLIVVADAANARFLVSSGPASKITELQEQSMHSAVPPTHELVRDRQTRIFESMGTGRSAVEPKEGPRRRTKREFAEVVAAALEQQAVSGQYQRIVIVAAPTMLGDMRPVLGSNTKQLLVAEIDKDLTSHSPSDLRSHLADHVVV